MPHEGYADPVMNNGPGFHLDIPVRELTERVTRAIEASDVSIAPLVAEIVDMVTHGTRPTPTKPNGARGLELPNPNSGIQPIEVRRPTHEGLEAASHQKELARVSIQ